MDTSEIVVLVIVGIVALYLARRSPQSAADLLIAILKRDKKANDIKRNDEDGNGDPL